jgi:hypothetical protein
VAPLLVGHALLDRSTAAGHHRVERLHDEEEDGGGDRRERDHVGEERPVAEDRVVDRERQVAEVRLADDHRDERHQQVVDEGRDDDRERVPITNATASSTMFPRSRKSRNSFSISPPRFRSAAAVGTILPCSARC